MEMAYTLMISDGSRHDGDYRWLAADRDSDFPTLVERAEKLPALLPLMERMQIVFFGRPVAVWDTDFTNDGTVRFTELPSLI